MIWDFYVCAVTSSRTAAWRRAGGTHWTASAPTVHKHDEEYYYWGERCTPPCGFLPLDTPMKFFLGNLVYNLWQHFWVTQDKNIFFALIKKIFLQTIVDPLTTKKKKSENITFGVLGQNRVKRMIWVHFWRDIWKIFKNEYFGFDIFEKRSNFDAFFRPSTIKT